MCQRHRKQVFRDKATIWPIQYILELRLANIGNQASINLKEPQRSVALRRPPCSSLVDAAKANTGGEVLTWSPTGRLRATRHGRGVLKHNFCLDGIRALLTSQACDLLEHENTSAGLV